jgi:peroxiredoxin
MNSTIRSFAVATAFFACWACSALAADPSAPGRLDSSGHPPDKRTLAIGDAAPDFALPGVDGRTHRLADFSGAEVLLVLFTSNHCPTSHGMEGRLQQLRDRFRGRSFALVAINPNHPDGLSVNELGYGEYGDSFEEMKPYAAKLGWDFPYLYDGDKQLTARAYGCLATPHVFIFDRARKLRYAGAFDDSRYSQEETVTHHYARDAIEALLAGRPVAVEMTKPFGCSTKWREKKAKHVATETAWTKIPVTVERIDAAGVAALRANPTGRFRLFNVWATWCAPCVQEFPDLVAIARKFDLREFDLITLSLDEPAHLPKAQAFLQAQGAGLTNRSLVAAKRERRATNHYLFDGTSQAAFFAALDAQAPGPIPHTVLVAPGGEIVWRHNGVIDRATAIRRIVEIMTPYYQPDVPRTGGGKKG